MARTVLKAEGLEVFYGTSQVLFGLGFCSAVRQERMVTQEICYGYRIMHLTISAPRRVWRNCCR